MGFGDEFQGMTDREILVDLAGKVKGAALMTKAQYDMLAVKVDAIHCPSPKCIKHDEAIENHELRLTEQERIETERCKKQIGRRELVIWGIGLVAGSGIGSGVLLKLMGG